MKQFLKQHTYFFCLVAVYIIAEVIVKPSGNFPLNDDWSYAEPTRRFESSGSVYLGAWPAMSLYTHIVWGALFIKIFGFSFVALRFSNMLSLMIGLFFLNRLVLQISGNGRVAILCCYVLMFIPMVFSLSNTFMTDINFNTLFILCCYLQYNCFQRFSGWLYLGCAFAFAALVLLRQYGVVFPASFIVASCFAKDKRMLRVGLALLLLATTVAALKIYEGYISNNLPGGAAYKFSGNVDLLNYEFWKIWLYSFDRKHREILIQSLMYLLPFSLLFLRSLLKKNGWLISVSWSISLLLIVYLIATSQGISSENVFSNLMVGAETFADSVKGDRHNNYPAFEQVLDMIRWISMFCTLLVIALAVPQHIANRRWKQLFRPETVGFITVILMYVFMLLLTESYFDRYHIPVITVLLILLSYLAREYSVDLKLAWLPVLFWAYISVLGTKDYLAWNRERWKAYRFLYQDLKISKDDINGGFEVCCWRDNAQVGWHDFTTTNDYRFLIQFNPEEDFVTWKEYPFQRYLPYRQDRILVLMKKNKQTEGMEETPDKRQKTGDK